VRTALAVLMGALVAAPVVRVTVVRSNESSATKLVLIVRVQAEGLVLGAYQCSLRFDPSVLTVDSATAGRDNFRLVNAQNASQGVILFNGFTTSGFTSADAVRIVARASKSLDAAKIDAVLEVAGDLDGKPVPKAALVAAHGVPTSEKSVSRKP